LLKDENVQSFDIPHGANMEEALTAAFIMERESDCQPFVQMIDPQTTQMLHLVRQRS